MDEGELKYRLLTTGGFCWNYLKNQAPNGRALK